MVEEKSVGYALRSPLQDPPSLTTSARTPYPSRRRLRNALPERYTAPDSYAAFCVRGFATSTENSVLSGVG